MSRLSPTLWLTGDRLFSQGFGILVFAIQAPLLGPHAFGVMSSVMVFIGFWEAVPGLAATDALISIRDPGRRHNSALLLTAVFFSLLLGGALWLMAEPLSRAMHDRQIAPIARVMAVFPLLQALSVVPTATAQRALAFKTLTTRSFLSQTGGGLLGIILAIAGAGAWALVAQALLQRVLATIILWMTVGSALTWRFGYADIAELLGFAIPNMASRTMSWAAGQLPRLILGLYLGPTAIGIFSLATRLHDIVAQVAIAPKAQVARVTLRWYVTDPDGLRAQIEKTLQRTSVLAFPLAAAGAMAVPLVISLWLDARWRDAVLPCQLLLLMSLPFVTIHVSASVLLALNLQRWEAALCTLHSVLIVGGTWIVAADGVLATALVMMIVAFFIVPVTYLTVRAACQISFAQVFRPQIPPLVCAALMCGAMQAAHWLLAGHVQTVKVLAGETLAGGGAYAASLALFMPALTHNFLLGSRNMLRTLMPAGR